MKAKKRRFKCAFVVLIVLVCAGCQAASNLTANECKNFFSTDNLIIHTESDEEHNVGEIYDFELILTDEEYDAIEVNEDEENFEFALTDEIHENEANGYEEDFGLALEPKDEKDYLWTWARSELLNMQDINALDDVYINEFFSNPHLNIYENVEIKEGVINILLYLFGHDVEEKDVFPAIDLGIIFESWLHEEGWTMLDEIRFLRESWLKNEERLYSIDTNFMMRLHQREDGRLSVSILIFTIRRGEPGTSLTYELRFEQVDGKYKLVWLGADS